MKIRTLLNVGQLGPDEDGERLDHPDTRFGIRMGTTLQAAVQSQAVECHHSLQRHDGTDQRRLPGACHIERIHCRRKRQYRRRRDV
jgi:hypothetical protein